MKTLVENHQKQEELRRRRALHTVMGNELCTTLLKSRIRMQKLLNEMNKWSVRPDPSDGSRQTVLAEAMAAFLQLQGLPFSPPCGPSLLVAERKMAEQHEDKMAAWRLALDAEHRKAAVLAGPTTASRKAAQTPGEALERVLSDRGRLRSRTNVSRSGVKPADARAEDEDEKEAEVGAAMDEDEAVILAAEREREKKKRGARLVCQEVYDDSDFYEQLLHDFIRGHGADVEGPVDVRKWSDLQQLRSKLKIVANDRSSKGRKVRYTVCPKMANITAPKAAVVPLEMLGARIMDDAERENLYRSLFR